MYSSLVFTIILLVKEQFSIDRVSKVVHDCIGFVSLHFDNFGSKNLCHLLNQSDAKLKPIMTCYLHFPALETGYVYFT